MINLDDIVASKETRTMIIIRNIPKKLSDHILNEVALVEFHGKYNLSYLPYDYEKYINKSYAFINFVNPLHNLYFYEKFNGKRWFFDSNICEINYAHLQGMKEIQNYTKNFRDFKKINYCKDKEDNSMIIPSKYLLKLKERFPKMQYTENELEKIVLVKSFE